jgi:hypothetical protein
MLNRLSTAALLAAATVPAQVPDQPEELGRVAWQRDFASARQAARERDLPLLVLFQEVPG